MRSILPSLEHAVALVYSTLPTYIYRAFDLRFKADKVEDDDGEYELNISIIGRHHLRIYYYHADSGLEQSLHASGISTADLTEESLRQWFIEMSGLDRWKADSLPVVDGLNRAIDLIFITMPKDLMIAGHETKLSVQIGPQGSHGPYDIVYFDPNSAEVFFTDGETLPALTELTPESLIEDLKVSFK